MERKTYLKLAALFLVIIYTVGRFGLVSDKYSAQFINVTWLNLVITAVLTFTFHQYFTKRFIVSSVLIFVTGFFMEWLGVRTGKIFGEYTYGSTLGFKVDDIPLLIGLNWLVLVYAVCNLANMLKIKAIASAFFGTLCMVLLDFFMEPFAVKFNLWSWNNNIAPIQNYVAWFIISFIMIWFLQREQRKLPLNYMAVFVYFLQLIFFASFLFIKQIQ